MNESINFHEQISRILYEEPDLYWNIDETSLKKRFCHYTPLYNRYIKFQNEIQRIMNEYNRSNLKNLQIDEINKKNAVCNSYIIDTNSAPDLLSTILKETEYVFYVYKDDISFTVIANDYYNQSNYKLFQVIPVDK